MKLTEHEAELMNQLYNVVKESADILEDLRPAGGFREFIKPHKITHEFVEGEDFVCPSDADHRPANWKKCKKCGFVEEPYTKKCDPSNYRSSMASYSCSTQSNSTQKVTAEERAQRLFHGKGRDVPPLAREYVKYLSNKYGGCSEVFLTGAAHYAQAIEGLACTDDLYKLNEEGRDWFKSHK